LGVIGGSSCRQLRALMRASSSPYGPRQRHTPRRPCEEEPEEARPHARHHGQDEQAEHNAYRVAAALARGAMTMPSIPPPVPFLASSAGFKRATADTGTDVADAME
jgi:hypothetical protein